MLLFFARPLYIFNIVLFIQLWRFLSYGPATFPRYFKGSASQVTQALWREEFSPFIWYFVVAVILDVIVQEYLPLIRGD